MQEEMKTSKGSDMYRHSVRWDSLHNRKKLQGFITLIEAHLHECALHT